MLLSIRNNITLYQLVMLLLRSCAGLEIVRSQLAINFSEQGISYQYSFGWTTENLWGKIQAAAVIGPKNLQCTVGGLQNITPPRCSTFMNHEMIMTGVSHMASWPWMQRYLLFHAASNLLRKAIWKLTRRIYIGFFKPRNVAWMKICLSQGQERYGLRQYSTNYDPVSTMEFPARSSTPQHPLPLALALVKYSVRRAWSNSQEILIQILTYGTIAGNFDGQGAIGSLKRALTVFTHLHFPSPSFVFGCGTSKVGGTKLRIK